METSSDARQNCWETPDSELKNDGDSSDPAIT